jgi:hypothetical protein
MRVGTRIWRFSCNILSSTPLPDRHSSYCAQICHHESLRVATDGIVWDLDRLDHCIADAEVDAEVIAEVIAGDTIARAEPVTEADTRAKTIAGGDTTGNTTRGDTVAKADISTRAETAA